jgi:rubrerythrin
MNGIDTILRDAIKNEDEAHAFYLAVAQRTADAYLRQVFSQMAADELGHRQFLETCLADPTLLAKVPGVVDTKVSEATPDPKLSAGMKPADAIALAMKKEQRAAEEYRRMAAAATSADYRRAFENLSLMELGHKAKMEEAYVNVGYPETF